MSWIKERIIKGKIELIIGAIMLIGGIVITCLIYDSTKLQSGGTYTLMFSPIIAGAFFMVMGLFKK